MLYQREVVQEICSDEDEYSPPAKCHIHSASVTNHFIISTGYDML